MDSSNVQMISGRFHCHKCKRDMNCVNENYNCPSCCSGFVEIMDVESDSQRDTGGTSGQTGGRIRRSTRSTNRPYNYTDVAEDDDEEYPIDELQHRRRSRNEYTPRTRTFRFSARETYDYPSRPMAGPTRNGGSMSAENRHETGGGGIDNLVDELMTNSMQGAHQQLNGYDRVNNEDPLFSARETYDYPSRPRRLRRSMAGPTRYDGSMSAENRHETRGGGVDRFLDEMITNFVHGAHQQLNGYDRVNNEGPLFFVGNPDDYAWGREGLDSIVSQLLNQMDACGPPPLAKDKIKDLPSLSVSQDQVDAKMQCSVCWETFQMAEVVRQLPCQHIYHETCIIPWLELHATCPICRKVLNDNAGAIGGESSSGNGSEGSSRNANLQNGLESLLRNLDNIRHHQRY